MTDTTPPDLVTQLAAIVWAAQLSDGIAQYSDVPGFSEGRISTAMQIAEVYGLSQEVDAEVERIKGLEE